MGYLFIQIFPGLLFDARICNDRIKFFYIAYLGQRLLLKLAVIG